nr:MAG TPA: hypothetical protein [Caudoviricetes sp.]
MDSNSLVAFLLHQPVKEFFYTNHRKELYYHL